jgi:hypothetical protein
MPLWREFDSHTEAMKTLLSLFDYTGTWAAPFANAGWNTISWDMQTDELCDLFRTQSVEDCFEQNGWESIDGIIAAVPCTDYASSGARWFAQKDMDGTTAKSNELVEIVLRIVDLYKPTNMDEPSDFFWAIENPVGRLNRFFPQLGKPYYFQPHNFSGYLEPGENTIKELDKIRLKNGHGITRNEADTIKQWEVYTKKTGLWGEFNRNLMHKNIEPVKGSPFGSVMMRHGSKSIVTKNQRSKTPRGFAQAFFNAQTQTHL